MILDVLVEKTNDGFTAAIPSLQDCETWAHTEDIAIDNIIDRVSFYLQIEPKLLKLDKARSENNITVYKLVIDKTSL